jgi:hypothetical protein
MMLAVPSRRSTDDDDWPRQTPDPSDWLSLQQAACELGVSMSTVRRRIRRGELRNRIVPRRGGFAYLVYVPGSRHARQMGVHGLGDEDGDRHVCREPSRIDVWRERLRGEGRSRDGDGARAGDAAQSARDDEIRRLQEQVDNLSEALSRALRVKQRALPAGMGDPGVNDTDPYARYRWMVRKRRWWPF